MRWLSLCICASLFHESVLLAGASSPVGAESDGFYRFQPNLHLGLQGLFDLAASEQKPLSLRRFLKDGDFEAFNRLFANATIELPDAEVSKKIIFNTFKLGLTELQCHNISLSDIELVFAKPSNQSATFRVKVTGVDVNCDGKYNYDWGFIDGNGGIQAYSKDNSVETLIAFNSTDFETEPPSNATVEYCNAAIDVYDLNFDGGLVASVLDAAESLVRDVLENQLESIVCKEFSELGTKFLEDLMLKAKNETDKYLQPLSDERADALYPEKHTAVPTDIKLLNFSDLGNTIGSWVDDGLSQANKMFRDPVPDDTGSSGTGKDLGVNVLIRKNLLDSDRAFTLNVSDLPFTSFDGVLFKSQDALTDTVLTLDQVRLYGLDTFTTFEPLDNIGSYTLQNNFSWEFLSVDMDITVDMKPSTKNGTILVDTDPNKRIVEKIKVSFGVDKLDVLFSIFVAVNQQALGDLEIGSMLRSKSIFPCLLSAMYKFEISGLAVSVGNIREPTLSGFVSPGIDHLVTNAVNAMFSMYEPTILKAVPGVFQTTVRDLLQKKVIDNGLFGSQSDCPLPAAPSKFVDFRDFFLTPAAARDLGATGKEPYGDIGHLAYGLIQDMLVKDSDSGEVKLNSALISRLTKSQSNESGSVVFSGDLFSSGTNIDVGGLKANVVLRVYDASIQNIDTFGEPLSLIEPVQNEAHILNNLISIGVGRPLRLSANFLIGIAGDDSNIHDDFTLSMNLDTMSILASLLMKIATQSLYSFPLRDVTETNCWLALLPAPSLNDEGLRLKSEEPSLSLTQLVANATKVGLNMSCIECSSPDMVELSRLLASTESANEVTQTANKLFRYASDLLGGEYLQVKMDRILNDAPRRCPHNPAFESENATATNYEAFQFTKPEPSVHFFVVVVLVAVFFLFGVALIVIAVKVLVRRRHRKWIQNLPAEKVGILWRQQLREKELASKLNKATRAMYRSSDIPCWIRIVVPLIVVCNIGLFLGGHLSLGGSVNIDFVLAGQPMKVENFYAFSMIRSVLEIWNAGGKELAIFILVFSIIWPYVKCIMTLVLWFAPPSLVSVGKRGYILLWLDALGKWSMVDIFVLVMMMAGFRISINSPDVGFLPRHFYSLDLMVVPKLGLYLNMTAQMVTQIVSHFILHFHRRICDNAKGASERDTSVEDSFEDSETPPRTITKADETTEKHTQLSNHAFTRPHRGEADKLVARKGINLSVLVVAFIVSILIILGCTLPSFSLEILGIVGVLVESGQHFQQARTDHSVFTIIKLLFDQAAFTGRGADYVGLGVLSFLMVVTVLLVPITQGFMLVYVWLRRMEERTRHRVLVAVETLQAWQYAEVYLLSVLVGCWQLGPVSDFMINAYCDGLDEFFAQMVFYGVLDESDAQCFRVEARVESATFVLAAGAILLALLNTFVIKAVTQYLREQEIEHYSERYLRDDAEMTKSSHEMREKITPTPVLFTDTFRWLLHHEQGLPVGHKELELYDEHYQEADNKMTTQGSLGAASSDENYLDDSSEDWQTNRDPGIASAENTQSSARLMSNETDDIDSLPSTF